MATSARQGSSPFDFLKRLLVGRALASYKAEHQLLPKSLALPVFASDQLSSVSYASEEMMLVLVLVGASGLSLLTPLSLGVAALLVIVIISYRQTVREYPRGGGSYIVARENLGTIPGLTAAAAIQTSYVLTVSVSMTAGAIAVTSAVPALAEQKVGLAVAFIALVTLANLRGAKEAGRLFAIPTYGFVVAVLGTILWGTVRCLTDGCPVAATADVHLEEEAATLSLFLVLRAFSSGATALTGVEAIADGVQAFRRPQSRNAAITLAAMGAMSIPMFLGISAMASALHVRVTHEIASSKSVLAQIGETVFGSGALFIVLQTFTALILILAANTAYQDFPRLSSILARDRFMPSQFRNRGDRLVYSNGIAVLSVLAALLVWAFDADLSRLIQLYVVGVFTALTLSQAGMVRRWYGKRTSGWFGKAALNAVGATTTGLVFVIVILTRFALGAWMVVVAVPVIVAAFLAVRVHYDRVGRALHAGRLTGRSVARNHVVLLVPRFGEATDEAIAYLRAIRPEEPEVFWIGEARELEAARETWRARAPRLGELQLLEGADRHLVRAVRRLIKARPHAPQDFLTILIPEEVAGSALGQLLRERGRAQFLLKTALLFQPGVVVTDIPFLPEEAGATLVAGERPLEPERSVVLIPVSAVHDPTVRAILYGRSLNPTHIEALFMVMDPEDQVGMAEAWHGRELDVPLVMVEAPFRDIAEPLLSEVRRHTSRGDTIVTVVLPELIPRHWWENLLHGQTTLFIKRLLLTEPRVVLTSVPFHLRHPEVGDEEVSPAPERV